MAETIERLAQLGFLRRAHTATPLDVANAWNTWGHATGFFHFSTRDLPWAGASDRRKSDVRLASAPAPPPGTSSKRLTEGRAVPLARCDAADPFIDVLKSRRTWRDFGNAPVPLRSLSALLDLTFGNQLVAVTDLGSRVVLKTSPSPGATQSLEAYVVVMKVADLKPGLYWYNADKHQLEGLRGSASPKTLGAWLGGQWWFEPTGILVFLTGSLARLQHKYRYARAYRSWLLEAGHVCQTFCLTATWLDLAPFCTQAIADSRVERALGLDPLHETVLYAMGAGTRPPGRERGPWPSDYDSENPYRRPRRSRRRSARSR